MKTEIERVCEIMEMLLAHQPIIDVSYETINDIAVALVQEGYGDISEYKAEIEHLRTTLGQCNTELNSALETLKSQCHEIGKLKAEIKQAQIDVLNKAKEKLDSAPNGWAYTGYIDELIKEVQDD